jgi:hypothetical protein
MASGDTNRQTVAAKPTKRPKRKNKAAVSVSSDLGLPRALEQTRRLLAKLEEEYKGISSPGHCRRHEDQGYLAFSKALPLLAQ